MATLGRRIRSTTLVLIVCVLFLSSSVVRTGQWNISSELGAPSDDASRGKNRNVSAQGPGWLDVFPYRKAHTINGSPGAGFNYQVEIEIVSGNGTDSGNTVYLPPEYWTPSDPIRFTDDDGVTLLDYWRECINVNNAVYWVEVKDNLDNDTLIYLYCGSSAQSDLSCGNATFLFFDDFENGNLGRWSYIGSQWNVTTYDKKYGSYSAYYDSLVKSDRMSANLTSPQSGIMIHCWYKPETPLRGGYLMLYTTVQGRTEVLQAHDYYWQYWNGSVYSTYGPNSSVTTPEHWDRCELAIDISSSEMMLWVNRTYIGAASQIHDADGNTINQTEKVYSVELAGQYNYQNWFDDYYVRKWISPEPVQEGWSPPEIKTSIWHDDCSNLTTFSGIGDNSWPHNTDVSVTFGSVKCSGSYFYCDDVGTGTGHHGPLYYATLANPFKLADFVEIRTEIEIGAVSADRRGWIRVGLHALDNATILTLQVADPGTGVSEAYANGIYRFINGTTVETPQDYPAYFSSEPYHESFAIFRNSSGLYSSFPKILNASLLVSYGIEDNRTVKYVSIQFNGYGAAALCETMKIYDIKLSYANRNTSVIGIDDFSFAEGSTGNQVQWHLYGAYPASYVVYHNSLLEKSGAWNSTGETVNISVDGLPLGIHDYTIIVNDTVGYSVSDTVIVTVRDQTPPSLDTPSDIAYNESTTGHTIQWHPSDLHPVNYTVYHDSLMLRTGPWNSTGETVTISVDGLSIGMHNYTIAVRDIGNNTARDTVFVGVLDGTSPIVDAPSDVQYDEGTTGHNIQWHPSDLHAVSYTVYRDTLVLRTGIWNSTGETVLIPVNGLALGVHNYTIVVKDVGGNSATDTIFVTVRDGTAPTIDTPNDFQYYEGRTGNGIQWHPADLHPANYTVYRDSLVLRTRAWNSTGETITISVDGLVRGIHNYTIVARDVGGNSAKDTVLVIVVSTTAVPFVWHHDCSNSTAFSGTGDSTWLWTYSGFPTQNATNGVFTSSGGYISATDLGTPPDIQCWFGPLWYHEFAIPMNLSDIVKLNVEFEIDPLGDSSTTGSAWVWLLDELHRPVLSVGVRDPFTGSSDINPECAFYFANGTRVVTPYSFVSSPYHETLRIFSNGSGLFGNLPRIGEFRLLYPSEIEPRIIKYASIWIAGSKEASSLPYTRTSIIRVHDILLDSYAVAVATNHPNDIVYEEGLTGNTISWQAFGSSPSSYHVYHDGAPIKSGIWNSTGETILISIDGLALGIHNYTIVVEDTSNNTVRDTVFVTIRDGTRPSIDAPSDMSYKAGETGITLTWNPVDAHPQSYSIFRNNTVVDSGPWNGSAISILVDGLSEGAWNYTLIVTDVGGNTIADSVFVRVLPAVLTTGTGIGMPMLLTVSVGGIAIVAALGTYFMKSKSRNKRRIEAPAGGGETAAVAEEEIVMEALPAEEAVEESLPAIEAAAVVSTIPEPAPEREAVMSAPVSEMGIEALRGGEFVGNRFRLKVKVANKSKYIISDVVVALLSYPRDSLRLDGESSKSIPRIDPEGFRSPTFEFTPTQDCVKGNLAASVSFIDYKGQPHSLVTKPYEVRAVCDLLIPETITANEFQLKLSGLDYGDHTIEVKEWTPEEMHAKTVDILKHANFYEVTSESRIIVDRVEASVSGWAKGKYTGKNVGVQITITGKPGTRGAKCRIHMSGEDEAMLMPAIDEIAHKLSAWLCPRCGAALPASAVECLKTGKSACCPFCGVTMDR